MCVSNEPQSVLKSNLIIQVKGNIDLNNLGIR